MFRNIRPAALLAITLCYSSSALAMSEWTHHRTSDGAHPDGFEQEMLYLINRARANPVAEGAWLATDSHPDVASGRNYFNVNVQALQNAFSAISAKPPAAFDVRLYNAAVVHNDDLIARQAQDHNNQLTRVQNAGFDYTQYRGNVYSYSRTPTYAHAGFNIDWGSGPNGMQDPPGHRKAIMSTDGNYNNIGLAAAYVGNTYMSDPTPHKRIGEWVVTQNFANADADGSTHFDVFLVGTVYTDLNDNGRYDSGEGHSGVTVMPSSGSYYAVTSAGGGYAIPVTTTGVMSVLFSGNGVNETKSVTLNSSSSVLLDVGRDASAAPRNTGSGSEDLFAMHDVQYDGSWGSKDGLTSFTIEFENLGHDLVFVGRHFNSDSDMTVLLNGQNVATLARFEPYVTLNKPEVKSKLSITRTMQIDGINTLEIIPNMSSGKWKFKQVRLKTVSTPTVTLATDVGIKDDRGYRFGDHSHQTVIHGQFQTSGSSNMELMVKGFHIVTSTTVSVYVNGSFQGYLDVTPSEGYGRTYMTLSSGTLVSGANDLELRFHRRPGKKWGVTTMRLDHL